MRISCLLQEWLRCLNYAADSARTHAAADSSGRLLPWLTCQECSSTEILALHSAAGPLLHTQQEIHDELKHHYTLLYQSTVSADLEDWMSF
ncbi:hypothetical protein NDU88_006642 [Pleurodeles waltl]|uniref:Uncharacterized protein n=1 Tax=Pleurodeles waltl TaxID=8319 RepID=A0AAV7WE70_PLEWA|nr:hypothetical protein NDU88_006642 [Pleurodeles waltl]